MEVWQNPECTYFRLF